ncbi:hypothetical protein MA03_06625 [Infirmifilum uzonense]|uniref:Probable GTP 3',8-cyclase n=1 Tax=Infirmifilum uzonense TaxID=1550241 RepID=A0A0F7CL88_9CREN|nr:GTP 3',8-cyclase MoaA [Infirmifilum uzonense]AKG38986.1 hypothetical protein MA03_06625 [Infirmifilum uzonense]
MLVDRFGRPLNNLRISVTGKCNYNCIFCHREGEENTPDELTADDIELVASAAYKHSIKSFKLTGGEPLIRRDIAEIVSRIKQLGKDVEVSMTTNGFYLSEYAGKLTEAGLDRINVSFHGVSVEKYRVITRVDGRDRVIDGLKALREHGVPVKLNFVLTALNANEVRDLLEFASRFEANVNIIELIPTGRGKEQFDKIYFPVEKILPLIESMTVKVERRELHNRPVYVLNNGVRVEILANFCNPFFCQKCTRIRLTHDAKLKPCLNRNDNTVNILPILRTPSLNGDEKINALMEAIKEVNSKREPYFRLVNGKVVTADGSSCQLRDI